MQLIIFTKHLEGLEIPAMIETLQHVGVDGADLCVRDGYPVTPENVGTALSEAAKAFATAGLSIPLVTTSTDFNRPDIDYTERLYAACGEAGVKQIKLGYWRWKPGMHYWDEVDTIRGYLDKFQALSAKTGVQTVVHNHSGHSMGLNSSSIMNLVRGFDPQHIGVFADPGHLSLCGEPIDMALDIVRDYLSIIAFKDFIRERVLKDGDVIWSKSVRSLGWGLADWKLTIATLKAMNFSGPISIHAEYSNVPTETVMDLARADTRFVRSLL